MLSREARSGDLDSRRSMLDRGRDFDGGGEHLDRNRSGSCEEGRGDLGGGFQRR